HCWFCRSRKNSQVANQIVWCDIPVLDLERAIRFYRAALATEVHRQEFPETAIGLLPHAQGEGGGCLFTSTEVRPSATGPLVYLNCNGRVDSASCQVGKNGGKLLQTKHSIGPHGFRAVILDCEGNRI